VTSALSSMKKSGMKTSMNGPSYSYDPYLYSYDPYGSNHKG